MASLKNDHHSVQKENQERQPDSVQMDINAILEYLPHRHPVVMIDRVLSIVPGKQIIAIKNVTYGEPFFAGHFPTEPIMPGVLVVEAMGQAGGLLAFCSKPDEPKQSPIYFMGMDRVRFHRKVIPGDQLTIILNIIKQRGKAFKMAAKALVGDQMAAEALMLATFGETPDDSSNRNR